MVVRRRMWHDQSRHHQCAQNHLNPRLDELGGFRMSGSRMTRLLESLLAQQANCARGNDSCKRRRRRCNRSHARDHQHNR